ncbi:glycosyltransferase [Pseudoxanthomonas daejeonensis]|uniref:Uncharacterized protein n=1 Tax=Pseudoxanthomonas daejeonensis TaxID=266062 RepID=A0ABQ6ZB00_9GAMM|nr:glycosyltransferase [Pseudoxanthomonas daejeonensis]KAF1696953.1 hypothetical protein CSC65_02640 [Pseudoxanthomonas daejeonensis]
MSDNLVNSKDYWDTRFTSDWEERQGRAQSRFFGALAFSLLPKWLIAASAEGLSWCDWGCALGDGTNELAINLAGVDMTGVDFSPVAIEDARQHYPGQKFVAEDWVSRDPEGEAFDVVFSSNTLEHFHEPWKVIGTLSARAQRAVALLLPFREWQRIDEHHVTFHPDNVPMVLGDGKVLAHVRVRDVSSDEPCNWPGEQLLAIWVDPEWARELGLHLSDMDIELLPPSTFVPVREQVEGLAHELDSALAAVAESRPESAGEAEALRRLLRHVLITRTNQSVGTSAFTGAMAEREEKDARQLEIAVQAIAPWLISESVSVEMRERVGSIGEQLADLQARTRAAEESAATAALELHGLRDAIEGSKLREMDLDGQLQESRRSASQTEAQLQEARRSASEIEEQLQEARRSASEAETKVQDGLLDRAALLAELDQARSKLEEGREEMQVAARDWTSERERLGAELEAAAVLLAERCARIEDLRRQVEIEQRQSGIELAFRDAALAGRGAHIQSLEQQLADMYRSRSWRITSPLREAARLLRRIKRSIAARRAASMGMRPSGMAAVPIEPRVHEVRRPPVEPLSQPQSQEPLADILHLVQDFVGGGLERVVLDLCVEMTRLGYRPAVAVLGHLGDIAEEARQAGIEVVACKNDPVGVLSEAERLGAKVCFTHHAYTGLDAIHANGVRVIEVLHNAYHWQVGSDWFTHLRSRSVDAYVAVSGFVRDYSVERLGLDPGSITLINNGLNTHGFIRPPLPMVAAHRRESIGSPRFLFAGNLHFQKNHLLVIRSFAEVVKRYPDAHLVMLGSLGGDAEARHAVEVLAAPLVESGSLTLAGSVGRRRMSKEFARAHVALLPTQLEGFSISTLEFAYFGLPSVLSETGASNELSQRFGHVLMAAGAATGFDELSAEMVRKRFYQPDMESVQSLAGSMCAMVEDYGNWLSRALDAAEKYDSYSVSATAANYCALVPIVEEGQRGAQNGA